MKKVLSIALALAMSLTLLVGCGGGGTSTPASTAGGDSTPAVETGAIEEGAKLVYWPMWAETEPQGMVIAQAIEAFTDATGVEVEVNFAGSRDTRKTLQPALDAGETIDVFDEDIERVNITWANYLLDIQEMYDASELNGVQNATLINLAKELGGGTLKSVPYQPSSFVVMYNKDLFDAAGITAVPTTWDEFLAACEALKANGVYALTVDDAYMAAFFGYMMDRVAGYETTKAVAAGDFTNEAVLKTAEAIQTLVDNGYIDPRAAGNVYPQGQSNIADESVAMYLNGTWLPNEIRNQTKEGFRWGSFALPNIAEGGDGAESNNYGVPMANDATWPDALTDAKAVIDGTTQRLSWAVDMENDANVNAAIKTNLALMISGQLDAQGFADAFGATQKGA